MLTTMLRSVREFDGYRVTGKDGEDLGKVHQFYFDGGLWKLRYLVVVTGPRAGSRRALIPPSAFDEPEWESSVFRVRVSREEFEGGIEDDEDVPDPGLRGTRDVIGYRLQAADGPIGRVDDFIVNDADWSIRYLVVDTHGILPGKKVLVSPWWVQDPRWEESKIHVALSRSSIEKSPEYDFSGPVGRDYEDTLFEHYGKPKYWV